MRVVLDTNVLVRAAANINGLAGQLLQDVAGGPHVLILSLHILSEVRRVLAYPRLRQRWRLDDGAVREFTSRLAAVGEMVRTSATPKPVVTADPDDDPIVETAVNGRADVLCTRDAHLLEPAVVEYCSRHGVTVLDDVALRHLLR